MGLLIEFPMEQRSPPSMRNASDPRTTHTARITRTIRIGDRHDLQPHE